MIKLVSRFLTGLGALGIVFFWALFAALILGYFLNIYHFAVSVLHPAEVPVLQWVLMIVGLFHLFAGGIVGWVF